VSKFGSQQEIGQLEVNRTLKDLGMNENIREDHKEIGCEDVD
jgi:hypothetical protein